MTLSYVNKVWHGSCNSAKLLFLSYVNNNWHGSCNVTRQVLLSYDNKVWHGSCKRIEVLTFKEENGLGAMLRLG